MFACCLAHAHMFFVLKVIFNNRKHAKEHKLKHKAKVAGYGEIQTGLVDQMWADVKRWVPKPITARNKEGDVNGLLCCYAYQRWLRTSCQDVTLRRQKLYKQWKKLSLAEATRRPVGRKMHFQARESLAVLLFRQGNPEGCLRFT